MSNLQVKNLDADTHEQLRRRAADEGTTISDYVLELIRRDLRRPTRRAWLDTVARLPRHDVSRDEVVGALRAGRDRE
jgi:antitoxin FitA